MRIYVDLSIPVGVTRRIGIDYNTRQFVVFDYHGTGFHGHVRTWQELDPVMQAMLRRAGMVDRRGNILGR